MAPTLVDALRGWRDFYLMAGVASATLVGLMFVAASIGASLFSEKYLAPMRAFITPPVVHFGAILFVAMVSVMPGHSETSLGTILGLGALAGLAYSARIFALIFRRFAATLDWGDRAFYALIPVVGYLLLLASAATELARRPIEANRLAAAALVVLMAASLRNAWDMTVWLTSRTPTGATPPRPEGG